MTEQRAREQFPIWAAAEEPEQDPTPWRLKLNIKSERFLKRYGIAMAVVLAVAIYSAAVGVITGTIVRHNVREEMEAEYRARMQAYIEEQEQQRMASALVTGEASRKAAMEREAREVARVLYGVKSNSESDLRTYVWCVLNRVDNAGYPNAVSAVVAQQGQWMGYSADNPVVDDLYKIALEEIETWYDGIRPVSPDYIYMHWTPSEITLRDAWLDGSTTHYWRWSGK